MAVTRKRIGLLRTAAILLAISLGLFLLGRTLRDYDADQIVAAIRNFPVERLVAAGVFAAASYGCLTFFDYFGLRFAGAPMLYRRAALASFVGLSLGHSIGFAGLSSGVIRYRFYSRWGASARQVASLVVFSAFTVLVGLTTLVGLATVFDSGALERTLGASRGQAIMIGVASLCIPLVYVALSFLRLSIRLRGSEIAFPSTPLAVAQVAIGTTNFLCVGACLHQCLLAVKTVPFLQVLSAYAAGNITSIISHVPGGLGVLETVVQLVVGKGFIVALLMFRTIYFLVPLAIGAIVLIVTELLWRNRNFQPRSLSHQDGSNGQVGSNSPVQKT